VAVAFCNRVGNEEGLTFWGGSRLIGADGSTIAEAPLYEEALVIGSIDVDDLRMQRYSLPLLSDERLELVRRELDRIIAERAELPPPADEDDARAASSRRSTRPRRWRSSRPSSAPRPSRRASSGWWSASPAGSI